MAYTPTCLVCQKEMEKGFIPDGTPGGYKIPRWCSGTPSTSWLSGMKPEQINAGLEIVAYRCPECHALRLYAPSTT